MGLSFTAFFDRIFYFPIKDKPPCYKKPDEFVSDEVASNLQKDGKLSSSNTYEQLTETFYERLLEERMHEKNLNKVKKTKHSEKYPGWNEKTVFYLHSLFLVFSDVKTKTLDFKAFSAILECLGDINTIDVRRMKFDLGCNYENGLLEFEDFLQVLYEFDNSPDNDRLRGLAQRCLDISEKTQQIYNLSVGKQLEYGLF